MRILAVLALVLALALALGAGVNAQEAKKHPCEAETAPLMTQKSSWDEMHRAALALPPRCLDGYFAEGISDAVVRKMGKDWPGFLALLSKHPQDNVFFRLVLRSINATLDPKDIRTIDALAQKSCPSELRAKCEAISNQAAAALADYSPPEPRHAR